MRATNLHAVKASLAESIEFLKRYLRSPMKMMREIPDWELPTLLVFQIFLGTVTGLLSALISGSFLIILLNPVLQTIAYVLTSAVISVLLHYSFLFFYKKTLNLYEIYRIVVIAHIYFVVLRVIEPMIGLVDLVGFAITAILVNAGLIKSLSLDRNHVFRVITGLFILASATWMMT